MRVSLSYWAEKSYIGIPEITLNPSTLEKRVILDGFLHNNMCEDISQLSTRKCSQLLFTYLNGDDSYAKLMMLNKIEKIITINTIIIETEFSHRRNVKQTRLLNNAQKMHCPKIISLYPT